MVCVDTVQYEGLREAINDMRYLATLQKAINAHPGPTANAAQAWISQVNPSGDLDAVRAQDGFLDQSDFGVLIWKESIGQKCPNGFKFER